MNKITVISNVENGNLTRNRSLIRDIINSFEGKIIEITFQKKRSTRSTPQNAYYFGVIIVLFCEAVRAEWGEIWSKEKAHEFLKSQFLFFEKHNEDTGEIVRTPKSTTECTKTEFEEYLTSCRNFMSEWFNVDAPLPNEQISLI
jgi:hypothetical protein